MKKLLLTLAAVATLAACNNDDQPAAPWQKLPTTPITGENAALTVNGTTSESGSVQLKATSATEGDLVLTNVLPGYATINMEVSLAERADEAGTFDFEGETGLTTPPSMITKAAAEPVIFNVSVRGSITPDGKTEVTLTSVLSKEAQGGLTNSWDMLKKVTAEVTEYDVANLLTAPLMVTWSAKDPEQPNAENTAMSLRRFSSSFLYQFLHSLTFSEDGNVTAEYWNGEGFDMQKDLTTYLMGGFESTFDDESWIDIPTSMLNLHEGKPWSESPKGLLYWYVKDDYLYIVPDIAAILAQIKEDSGTDVAGGQSDISALLTSLEGYGIDINKLLPLVTEWMQTGIPLKYEKTVDGLKLYADKEMCAPVIEALLPAMPALDEKIAEMANSEDEMMQMLPQMLPTMLGVENLAALDPIWKNNTDQFEISLHFVNKVQ